MRKRLFPQDCATISATAGGTPIGTVRFQLFGPADTTCSGTPVFDSGLVPLAGGSASTSNTTFSVDAGSPGTYRWLLTYSGDATHDGSTGACGVERFTASVQ